MLIQFADVADEQWGICHNTQIQIQIHKYKFTNTIHKYKLKLLIFVRPISCLSVTTTHYLSNYSLHKSTQLWITVTAAGVTSQHIISSTYCQRQPAQVIRYFPAAAFTTILASQTPAATWSPSLEFHHSSYHWVGLTKRDEKSMWHDAQCTNFWRICLGSPRFWFDKLQKLFFRFSLSKWFFPIHFFQYICFCPVQVPFKIYSLWLTQARGGGPLSSHLVWFSGISPLLFFVNPPVW